MDILMAEYERLGRPLDDADLNPDHIVDFVGQHFEGAGGAPSFAEPPRPPSVAAVAETPAPSSSDLFYVVNAVSGEWEMHAIALDGQIVQTVTLPDPGVGGYYTMLFTDTGFNLMASNQQVPIPCCDLLVAVLRRSHP